MSERTNESKRAGEIMSQKSGKLIGKKKYTALKALGLDDLTEDSMYALELQFPNLTVTNALEMIKAYEDNLSYSSVLNNKSVQDYYKEINKPEIPQEKKEMTKEWLWNRFVKAYYKTTGNKFIENKYTVENIKPLILYFIGDFEGFSKCANISTLSKPSFKKGLLIIGGYGNGKTSIMDSLEIALRGTNVSFKGYTAHEIVAMYDAIKDTYDKDSFNKITEQGTRCFDDVLTEKIASNYGKVDIFQLIFEKRYNNNARTYITINFDDDFPNDVDKALDQLGLRYGGRVYDRIFAMWNIIIFKGDSFRK